MSERTYTLAEKIAGLWRAGRLGYKLKPIQRRIREKLRATTGKLFVAVVARQTGKTYGMAVEAVECALSKPGARIKYGAAFQSELLEYILPTFHKVIEDAPADVVPKYRMQGTKFIFQNGSEIKLVGLDRHPDGLRGNAIDLIILDECGFIENLDYLYKSVIVPTTRHRPNCKIILISTPPESPDHDFTEYVQRAQVEGNYFLATIHDDETCKEETIKELQRECGGEDSTTWKREFLCQFIVDADLAIIPEWKDDYVAQPIRDEFHGFYQRYTSMDLGVVDYTANVFGYYDFKRATLVIEDETGIRGPELTTDKLADLIKAKESELWGEIVPYRRISDCDNPLLLNDLGVKHNMHFMATSKDELPAMINEVRLLVKQGRLLVHPRCKMLIGCLAYGIFNSSKIKREFARSRVYGHFDWLAALVYLVRNLDVHSCPIPKTYGVTFDHYVKKEQITPQYEKQFQKIMGKKQFVRTGVR